MIPTILLALALGALSWSFLEYVIHRWAGHHRKLRGNIFEKEHTQHHSVGDYFAASWKKAAAAVIVLGLVVWPAMWVAGTAGGITYAVGFAGFYLYYEFLHRALHMTPGIGTYGRWARSHHFHHHFGDPQKNFGVTSPVWDWAFGTLVVPERIRVPEKLSMRWLVDPSTGDVFERFAALYELRRRKRTPA